MLILHIATFKTPMPKSVVIFTLGLCTHIRYRGEVHSRVILCFALAHIRDDVAVVKRCERPRVDIDRTVEERIRQCKP